MTLSDNLDFWQGRSLSTSVRACDNGAFSCVHAASPYLDNLLCNGHYRVIKHLLSVIQVSGQTQGQPAPGGRRSRPNSNPSPLAVSGAMQAARVYVGACRRDPEQGTHATLHEATKEQAPTHARMPWHRARSQRQRHETATSADRQNHWIPPPVASRQANVGM